MADRNRNIIALTDLKFVQIDEKLTQSIQHQNFDIISSDIGNLSEKNFGCPNGLIIDIATSDRSAKLHFCHINPSQETKEVELQNNQFFAFQSGDTFHTNFSEPTPSFILTMELQNEKRKTLENLIILEGGIAAGKTTLLRNLGKKYGFYAIEEPAESNPHLANFYADPQKYAYTFQLWFLNQRIEHFSQAVSYAIAHPQQTVVLDRSVYSDYVFALNCHNDGFISAEQFAEYQKQYKKAIKNFPNPQLMVYLDVDPETCLYRIKNVRKRECEQGIQLSYLQGVHKCYGVLLEQMKGLGCNTMRLNWEQFGSAEQIKEIYQNAVMATM